MKAKDIFGLVIRIFGIVFLYQGLNYVPSAINSICPAFPHFLWRNIFPSVLMVGWPLAIGYWLIRGAPWLMRLAYGNSDRESGGNANATQRSSPGSLFE